MNKSATVVAGITATLIIAAVAWLLLTPAPTLTDRGYDVAMALLRACNQRDLVAIQEIETSIQAFTDEGQLATKDAKAFRHILELAKDDEWQSAAVKVRSLMVQQAKPANLPDLGD